MCDGGSNGAVVGLGGNFEKIVVLVGWDVKGLVEKEGPACMLRSLCPSKIFTSTALAKIYYFCVEWAVLVYLSVVEFTIFEAPSLKVKFSTKLDSISLWDVFSVGVERFSVFLTVF